MAEQLALGEVVVIFGRANLAEPEDWAAQALSQVLAAAPGARVLPVLRRANVRGALAAGLFPGEGGLDATGILEAAAGGRIGCLVLLGADPLSDFPDTGLARRALAGAGAVIAVDTHLTASSRLAHVLLPAAAFGEKPGTTTNLEGRVTTLSQKVTAPGGARADWMIAADLADALGADLGMDSIEAVHDQMVATAPAFAPASSERAGRPARRRAPGPSGLERQPLLGRRTAGTAQLLRPAPGREPDALRRRGGRRATRRRWRRSLRAAGCTSTRWTSIAWAPPPAPR